MKQPVRPRPKYRLSPGEIEQLKKEETERRRKLRIVQVREQSKAAAAKIRNNVKQEKERQLLKLAKEVETQLEEEKNEEVKRLEKQYENTLRTIGQAHTQAQITEKSISHAEQLQTALENKKAAEARHRDALRKLALDKAYKEYDETKHIRDRQAALEEEKKRAAEVASRPPPPPDPVSEIVGEKQKISRPIPLTDVNAFSTTHYHMPDFAVEKAPPEQQLDGKLSGEIEDERTKDEVSTQRKKQHDQLVRARIRGNEALKKEMLKHDYDALMADLSLQQKNDRRRRQNIVSKMPKQVFLPPDRRIEEKDDRQLEMERAFEDMYMQQINISGNLSLTLDPNPIPESPAGVEKGGEEGATEEDDRSPVVVPSADPALREVTNISRSQKATGKPETGLKKLLSKIKEQHSEVEGVKVSQKASAGAEKQGFKGKTATSKGKMAARGPRAPSPVQPDPELDLSPLRAAGNQRPQSRQREEPPESEDVDQTDVTTDSEAHFLDKLKGRLEALESQKEYLDRRMKERQQMYQQQHQPPPPGSTYVSVSTTSQPPQQPTTASMLPSDFQETLAQPPASISVMLQTADLIRERDRALQAEMGRSVPASSSVAQPFSSAAQLFSSAAQPFSSAAQPFSSIPQQYSSMAQPLSQPVPETGKQVGSSAVAAGSRTNLLSQKGDGGDSSRFQMPTSGGVQTRDFDANRPTLFSVTGAKAPVTEKNVGQFPGTAASGTNFAPSSLTQPLSFSQPHAGMGLPSLGLSQPAASGSLPASLASQSQGFSAQPLGVTSQYSGLGSQAGLAQPSSSMPGLSLYQPRPLQPGLAGLGLSASVNGAPGSRQAGIPSASGMPGLSTSLGPSQTGIAVPIGRSLAVNLPLSSVGVQSSAGMNSGVLSSSLIGGTEFHSLPASLSGPSLVSRLTGRQFQPLSASLASLQAARSMNASGLGSSGQPAASIASSVQQVESSAARAEQIYSTLAARLASGLQEEERLRQVREYQRQLIDKHEQRMKALAETRAKIESRQVGEGATSAPTSLSASQSLLSASGRLVTDPAVLAPYTLRPAILQPESQEKIPGSTSAQAMPGLMSNLGSFAPSQTVGPESGLGSFAPSRPTAPVSSLASFAARQPSESRDSSFAREPILAGSAGIRMAGDARTQETQSDFKPSGAYWGDRGVSAAAPGMPPSSASDKFDRVRKSLPFDNPDETLHREDADGDAGDTDGISMADDSHISSSTDRGSPALGSRSNKSSGSGHSGSLGSGVSDGSIGGSSLVARAEEKRISFEQRQKELQDQLAEIQRQKDALLQRYHGNQQKVATQEESVRSKLRAAQAATSLSSGQRVTGSASAMPTLTPAPLAAWAPSRPQPAGLTSELLPSASPSMELEEGSLSSEKIGRPGSGLRSWATELEEYSMSQDKNADKSKGTPGSLTLEEISIMSEREWGSGVKGERSGDGEARPSSSLSSLQEVSIISSGANSLKNATTEIPELSMYSLSAIGSQESLVSAKSGTSKSAPSGQGRVSLTEERVTLTSVGDGRDVEMMLRDLGKPGVGGAGLSWSDLFTGETPPQDNAAGNAVRLPPPPTRQPVPVAQYEPHELSTILEVDTPQTASKTLTAVESGSSAPRLAGGSGDLPASRVAEGKAHEQSAAGEKSTARRFIDFGKHSHTTTSALDDDRDSKFSASGSSASSDVRSVIEVIRPGVLRASASRPGSDPERVESRLSDKGDFNLPSTGFSTLQQQGQNVSDTDNGSKMPGSQDTTMSSARSFQPLTADLTLGSLTPRSPSMEDSRARRYLDFSGDNSATEGATSARSGGLGMGDQGAVGRGGAGAVASAQVADVLRQARQFNKDLMAAIQRQSADVFDQSNLSFMSH